MCSAVPEESFQHVWAAPLWLSGRLLTARDISANCNHPRDMSSAAQVPPRTNEEILALLTDGSSQLLQVPTLG